MDNTKKENYGKYNHYIRFLTIDLFVLAIVGSLSFILEKDIRDYLFIFTLLIAIYSFVSLLSIIKNRAITGKEKINDTKEFINCCLSLQEYRLLLILNSWVIYLIVLQSFLLTMGYSDSTSGLAIINGGIISFIFSLLSIFAGTILVTRKIKKDLLTVTSFFLLTAVFIGLWILLSSIIIAVLSFLL